MVYRGKNKPLLEIRLTDGQEEAFIPSYTSLDQIHGNVSLTAQVDTSIKQVYITFEGIVKTYVEKIASSSPTNGRTEAFQTFLRLVQPVEDAALPPSGMAEAGKTYTFPFTFAVPDRLLPQACEHSPDNDVVHQTHLTPPPTLGDPMTAVWGKSMMDDMAPDMAVVSYAIRARITTGRGSDGKLKILADATKKVRFIPAIPEHPPLVVSGDKEDDYRLRKEKNIKKGTFQGRLGTLVMESAQPQSFRLPPPRSERGRSITTMATIKLRFDPACVYAEPPRLGSLATKLKAATFFASTPMQDIPNRSSDFHYSSTKGLYVETLPLSSRCVASVQWHKHDSPPSSPRRNSAESTVSDADSNIPEPSSTYKEGRPFYTARILVPLTLPEKDGSNNNKLFVPSFHSCLLSRIYALDFYLSCHTPGTSVTAPNMHLKLPIQVSAEPNPHARPSISEGEAQAIARREAAEFQWNPRSVAPPRPSYAEATGSMPQSPASSGFYPTDRSGQCRCSGLTRVDGVGEFTGRPGTPEGLPPPDYSLQTTGRLNVSSSVTRFS
ncbi:MAG: hypothetical protein Q9179_001349 [Wetmoreana sp. 5 TL-2023]